MIELCLGMLFMAIAAAAHWLLGIYDKVIGQKLKWNWLEFGRGVLKIALIAAVVIALGVVWEFSNLDLSGAGLEPKTLISTATIYYAFNAIKHLANIIKPKNKEELTATTSTDTTTPSENDNDTSAES
jgi:hypothetical protein